MPVNELKLATMPQLHALNSALTDELVNAPEHKQSELHSQQEMVKAEMKHRYQKGQRK